MGSLRSVFSIKIINFENGQAEIKYKIFNVPSNNRLIKSTEFLNFSHFRQFEILGIYK
jgi:hypothetical protein